MPGVGSASPGRSAEPGPGTPTRAPTKRRVLDLHQRRHEDRSDNRCIEQHCDATPRPSSFTKTSRDRECAHGEGQAQGGGGDYLPGAVETESHRPGGAAPASYSSFILPRRKTP